MRGFRPRAVRTAGLRGYWFELKSAKPKGTTGFFAGFLNDARKYAHLHAAPPECVVFAFVEPLRSELRRVQIENAKGTLRWTFEYIRWLSHRPPRFEFYEEECGALVRHVSMRDWPREKWEHFSRNFYIETLAWLVRSGLVRRWRELAMGKAKEG